MISSLAVECLRLSGYHVNLQIQFADDEAISKATRPEKKATASRSVVSIMRQGLAL